ncbi:MAG: TIM44-like domain-containing protein [Vicinamibacteria bacterium]
MIRCTSILVALLLVWILPAAASARPAGGQSYRGGSGSGTPSPGADSSGSSSSADRGDSEVEPEREAVRGPLVRTSWDYALFVVIGVSALGFFLLFRFGGKPAGAATSASVDLGGPRAPPPPELVLPGQDRDELCARVLARDPDFSLVLFEDFASTLYAQLQRARHDEKSLEGLGPYLTAAASQQLAARPGRVEAVVVGSISLLDARESGDALTLVVGIEANLHTQIDGREVTQLAEEQWTFSRALAAKTRPVRGVRKLGCPSCGAPFRPQGDGRCEACGRAVGDGRYDWQLTGFAVAREEERPHSLTGNVEEAGTDAPTIFQPFVSKRRQELTSDDPAVTPESLTARLRLIQSTLLSAWAAQDLRAVRPFLSERQHVSMQFWVDVYKGQGLRNLVAEPRFERAVVARVERDRHYDAVVMRLWASGFDYTEETTTGSIVGGSKQTPRRYSEYWTLVRSATVRGAPRTDRSCPACAAPLDVNMAGECEHCGVHLTSGEFDWVLSKIEQDEAYRG